MNLLSLKNISKTYDPNDPPAVSNVAFDCVQREVVGLIGSSGSGKTTLLRIIAGLEIADEGEIILKGKVLNDSSTFIAPEKRDCSLVFQDYALFPNKTVWQNIAFGKKAANDNGSLDKLMEMADITDLGHRYPHEISGGQQQRVALVRALANKPTLLLLDEPLSHLDPELKENVRSELLKLLRETSTTTLFVSHDTEDAMIMADRIVVMRNGNIEQIGAPNVVFNKPVNSHVARLFGKTNLIPAELLPTSMHKFPSEDGKGQVVSIRPHEWKVTHEAPIGDRPSFTGEIKSLIQKGAYQEAILNTPQFEITLQIPTKTELSNNITITTKQDH